MRLPADATAPMSGLPREVHVYEVGPRDGLQNESRIVPTEIKAEFITRLARAGMSTIEVTSFVRPEWVPQLADASELLQQLPDDVRANVDLPVLVPNERGLERALELGVNHIAVFGSATESFAQRNLNRSFDEQFAMFAPTMARAVESGVRVRAYLSMCFGDPWEGEVKAERVVLAGRRLLDLGAEQLSLGDTIGVATPGQVTRMLASFADADISVDRLAVHFHDTYGQGLANSLAALQSGVTTIDASAGGIGGCPFARSSTGNLATEDLVWMLDGLGIHTGVDIMKLADTSRWMAGELRRPSPSRVVSALTRSSSDPDE